MIQTLLFNFTSLIINMNFAIIIPARYESSRFPGKPLADLCGHPVIEHVCRNAAKSGFPVYVATDDERIYDAVQAFGGHPVMTSVTHRSGTDRLCEAVDRIAAMPDAIMPDVVINVQGDEPFVDYRQISLLADSFVSDSSTRIATLAREFDKSLGFETLFDPNLVKVTFDNDGKALYFSRSIIPYVRNVKWQEWLDEAVFYTHIGVYAYRTGTLRDIAALPPSSLEMAESLEQLRWLQNGIPVHVRVSDSMNVGIDTPQDLEAAAEMIRTGKVVPADFCSPDSN